MRCVTLFLILWACAPEAAPPPEAECATDGVDDDPLPAVDATRRVPATLDDALAKQGGGR